MMKPVRLKINNYYSHLGIDTAIPIFGWQLESEQQNQSQTHYRIILAKRKESVISCEQLLWDSGKVSSSEQFGIVYQGQPLQSVTAYYWRVAVWNQHGVLAWSEVQTLFTGYLNAETWKAEWIGSGGTKPFYARTGFSSEGRVKRAYALVSGLGHFKLYMNGEKVGPNEMDPGWTNYTKSVQYVCFDVTDKIREGSNVIGFSVGNGFYAGDAGDRHFYTIGKGYKPYGTELLAIGEWHIEYEDGSVVYVRTEGENWKVRECATTLANVYGSENFDARLYPNGWYGLDFDDSGWETAKVLASPAGNLVSQNQPPITVRTVYDTIGIEEPLEQVYIYDLGQNMSGMFEIYVSGPAGSKVTIKPGELRNENGTVATPWDIVTYSEYTLAGTGDIEVWKPDFSCYGARWVQIEGCTRDGSDKSKPIIHDVKGHFVTSASEDVGRLETDDPRITKLAQIIIKAIESNLHSVHSDCPTIEKLGWIETASLMGPSIMCVKSVEELWLKITRDMMEAQTEEGLIPDIAPEYSRFSDGFRDSIAWGSAIILVPELLLQTYGNRTAMEETYPAMKAYLNYLKLKEVDGGLINHGLGDWGIAPQTGGDYIENVETAFYYESYRLTSKFASLLGLASDAEHYAREAERVKRCYNAKLLRRIASEGEGRYAYCKLNGEFDPLNQVVQAIPLYFGLVDEEYRSDIESALLHAASGRQLRSGEIGLRYLFGALAGMKRNDIVFDMMMQPEHPSYIRFVERGETALPEFWTDDSRSRNHDMMGHILEWLYKELLGISSVGDAYKEILIAPGCSDLIHRVTGSHRSVRGEIHVDFMSEACGLRLAVTLPPNTSGMIKLPIASDEPVIMESDTLINFEIVQEHGRLFAISRVGSGSYQFEVREKGV
ncbi:family 78 glycoside hydrolase catalytic domain [Paenibacillus sp. PL91]|uniref:family 78 glycoside hydrolase catalytic domain n=1 Tax=Paenibacillus sp. PL91 TaxID=2729538 RepID=UPI00145C719D|nr:family 78 glycoside hydrolase catalytic domain [Paenibacillus sp. PL91]MBC9203778.1 family 78 glycoside hydrolase catalytic domain [Paenibacillus sp. PL91]